MINQEQLYNKEQKQEIILYVGDNTQKTTQFKEILKNKKC